ncbi:MAG TPA: dTDP-4-dehydrorhamnose reductase [Candidatus Eremiobacteraeota bacterium]|nr:MAG: dTDP-4-dehydrorhamnose reductase [bacterium ADurb.Bin363]HPZ07516.1 dTDP-4-dehydrorhamnose reductase [Candidatus Eremiobacteraeota bacterium]
MKYLVLGKKGQLGKDFVKELNRQGRDFSAFDIDELDIGRLSDVLAVFEKIKPSIVINCAACNQVDMAEERYDLAYRVNSLGVRNLAFASKKYNSFLVHYSSDYIFDGSKTNGLYIEEDAPHPLNEYGKSKYLGELFLKEEMDKYLILRLSWVFGEGEQNFIHKLLDWSKKNEYLKIASDEVSVPTYTGTVVQVTLRAMEKALSGLYHLTNSGYASRYEWARFILNTLNINKVIYPVSKEIFNLPARRPAFSAMSNEKISKILNIEIPFWEEEIRRFINKYGNR